ncbi:DMT family transporter [Candidatus Woesearchaeota archaeon]|nr:DMT family transporter [Candidatus Woesearchaeota archaeon]
MDNKKIGVLAVLAAALMWAIEPIVAKIAYRTAEPLQTFTIRTAVIALIAAVYIIITNKGNFKVTKKQFPKLVYLAVVGTLVADLFYYLAFKHVAVLNSVIIGHIQPVFVVLIGFFILKEDKVNRFDYAGIIAMIIAALMVTTKTMTNLINLNFGTIGDLFVLIAAVSWATTTIVARKYLKGVNAGVITFYREVIALIFLVGYLVYTASLSISNFYQILVGIIVGVGTILYYEGLNRMKAAQVSALELASPFFAASLGFLILGEKVTIMQILGIGILCFGIYLLSKKEREISNIARQPPQ